MDSEVETKTLKHGDNKTFAKYGDTVKIHYRIVNKDSPDQSETIYNRSFIEKTVIFKSDDYKEIKLPRWLISRLPFLSKGQRQIMGLKKFSSQIVVEINHITRGKKTSHKQKKIRKKIPLEKKKIIKLIKKRELNNNIRKKEPNRESLVPLSPKRESLILFQQKNTSNKENRRQKKTKKESGKPSQPKKERPLLHIK